MTPQKKNTGALWEITVDGKPRTYDHQLELAVEAAQHLKLKNPMVEVTCAILRAGMDTSAPGRARGDSGATAVAIR